jgi:Protein of unknown function (DUF3987)
MTHYPIDRVLEALRGLGIEPAASGSGYSCRCPAHEDRSPSLTIGIGDDGRVLLHCHGGCSTGAVLAALDMEPKDLFPVPASASSPRRSSARPAGKPKQTFPTTEAAEAQVVRRVGRQPTARWEYFDAAGDLVGLVIRFDGPDGKTFRPVSRTTSGSWVCEGMPAPRPIFKLPQVLAADGPVFVCEGEKACDAIRSLGLTVTTSPNGSKSAGKSDWSPLKGRRVVILPDNDAPGAAYAADVVGLALRAGAESVKVVRLIDLWPGLPEHGDAADWVEHFDAVDAVDLRQGLETLVAAAQPVAAVADDVHDDDVDDDESLAWEPFPVGALPKVLAKFVKHVAYRIGGESVEAQVALPMLAALAGAIGNARAIEARPGWQEPAVLWTCIIAGSGGAKSPAYKAAMQFVFEEEKAARDAHRAALADFDAAEMEHSDWKRERGNKGPAPDRPVKPTARRLWVDDTTVEALATIVEANPRWFIVAREELRAWAASFDCYKSGGRGGADQPKWLTLYDAGPLSIDRKGGDSIHVPRAAVSLTGGIQPGIFARTMTADDIDSGLLGRLLVAMPPAEELKWPDGDMDWATVEAVRSLFRTLFDMPTPADGPKVLDMEPDAQLIFKRFYQQKQREILKASGAVKGMLSKSNAAVLRLALIIHVCRQAAGEVIPDRVDAESINRAIDLGHWFAREGRRVYQLLLGGRAVDRPADDAAAAERWIEGKGGFASLRDLRRGPARFRDDDDRVEAAVGRLLAEGRARREAPPTGGRTADGIRLVAHATKV